MTLSALPGWAANSPAAKPKPAGNFDIRVGTRNALAQVVSRVPAPPVKPAPTPAQLRVQIKDMQSALAALQGSAPGATVHFSPVTVAPEMVASERGALSAAAPGQSGFDIVRAFLHANRALYGLTDAEIDALHFLGESVSPRNGMRMVRVEQLLNNRPVFQSESRFILDRSGRVWRSLGLLMPNAAAGALNLPSVLTAPQALAKAMQTAGLSLDATRMSVTGTSPDGTVTQVVANDPKIKGKVASDIVYFPAGPGVLVPAWRQIAFTRTNADWYTVTDATTGALLWRKNIRAHASTQEARFSVYVQGDGTTPAESPAPNAPTTVTPGSGTQFPEITRTNVNMSTAQNLTFSPDGWIPDGGTTTTGNNVDAYLDTDADNAPDTGALDNNGRPVGNPDVNTNNRDFLGASPRDYTYSPAPLGGNPDAGDDPALVPFQRGAVTQLFYVANWYHDQLYGFGFDEAAGNFQTTNFSGMGTGGDPVLAETQDGDGTDNSNFSTPPDGTSGRMQMFIFDFPTPERDGSLDADIVLHEMTHGLSNRLIGNAHGLIWDEGGGMGEGWSDFYAMSLTHNSNAFPPNAEYSMGAYATYQFLGLTDNYLYGIRRFPYSTDNTVNPLTWADADDVTYNTSGGITPSPLSVFFDGAGALEVHNVGEIWALSLWEVRSRIIADPAGANGDVPTGNATMLQLTTDALKMTPINPSFTDARDALIAADCVTNACANEASIWGGFADRGLGYGAIAPLGQSGILGSGGHVGVGESFKLPFLDLKTTTVDDSFGNNNGAIDPGEPIKLTVVLVNPWHNAAFGVPSAAATLTSSTPGVTILNNASTYPAIAAQSAAGGTPFLFTLSTAALCGQSLHFTLTSTSTLGTASFDFVLRVGDPTGPGAPVTYTRTVPGGLAIPDDDFTGVTDSFAITDDLQIDDLQFRVDDLKHTFTGDLTVELKAPNGYGTDLIYLRGFFILDGDGDNFTNTVIDEASSNDLNLADSTQAPYTDSWAPAFNSGIWSLFGVPNLGPDPIGQLASRLDGQSTQGTWKVHATDEATIDTGTLNSWSLIVTPETFACTAVTPTVAVTGTKTAAGTFQVGGTVTYTVTLTNNGSGVQADNPGNEFTDPMQTGLTLVSATATSGTAFADLGTNTVTWNGAIAPAGGTVTITITATIKAGAGGTTILNQGIINFDADVNGTNESTTGTDDPGTATPFDPTAITVAPAPFVVGTKSVAGSHEEGSQ
ncbi:MAG TPA: M36 family metallopeptidase, partial [Thermoanaerobaculia bacterium]|nr:M36 family metallopeptidase [Thermoanaerobaculia bacterium]